MNPGDQQDERAPWFCSRIFESSLVFRLANSVYTSNRRSGSTIFYWKNVVFIPVQKCWARKSCQLLCFKEVHASRATASLVPNLSHAVALSKIFVFYVEALVSKLRPETFSLALLTSFASRVRFAFAVKKQMLLPKV